MDYALNPDSEVVQHKAKVFKAALGYDRSNWQSLLEQIRQGILVEPAPPSRVDRYGARFTVDIQVTGPAGTAVVRIGCNHETAWLVPRLVTLYVRNS
jgi:filamentous hemagglutinin